MTESLRWATNAPHADQNRHLHTAMIQPAYAFCTYNRAARLPPLVAAMRAQACSVPFEIFAVNDSSSDDTPAALAALASQHGAPLRWVTEPVQGIVAAHNRTIEEAMGSDILVFIDDDELPQPRLLAAAVDTIVREQAECGGGRVTVDFSGLSRPRWLEDDLLGFLGEIAHGCEPFWIVDDSAPIWSGNVAYDMRLFRSHPARACREAIQVSGLVAHARHSTVRGRRGLRCGVALGRRLGQARRPSNTLCANARAEPRPRPHLRGRRSAPQACRVRHIGNADGRLVGRQLCHPPHSRAAERTRIGHRAYPGHQDGMRSHTRRCVGRRQSRRGLGKGLRPVRAARPAVDQARRGHSIRVLRSPYAGYLDDGPLLMYADGRTQTVDRSLALERLVATVNELQSSGKRVILIAPPPRPGFDVGACHEQAGRASLSSGVHVAASRSRNTCSTGGAS